MAESDNVDEIIAAVFDAEVNDSHSSSVTIWDELNDWGKSLASWQRFIISHAVRDGALSEERVNEAYRLFLRDNTLDAGDEELPEIPASVTGRDGASDVSPFVIQELRALKNVNAIPETSTLTFGTGLTVVYGHNGAGKSGFARLLSSACFSRSEPNIIPNIYDDKALDTPATAEFIVDKGNGMSEAIAFTVGDENADLQRVSVFDSSVARISVSKEDPLGFQPAGFDVFDELMRVVGLIVQKLDADIASRTKPNKFDQLFNDPGTIAEQLVSLTANSDIAALRALGVFGQVEQDRVDELARQGKELSIKSPVEILKALAAAKADIVALKKKMAEISQSLGDGACAKVRALLDEHRETTAAAIKAGAETVTHPNLTKTGNDEWDTFIEASRTLGQAERDTYPAEGDPCLLCHRPLDEPSATLIKRMWGYLDANARKAALAADEKINTFIDELRVLEHALLPQDSRVRAELSKINPGLVAILDDVSMIFGERRDALRSTLAAGHVDHLPSGDLKLPDAEVAIILSDIEAQETALKDGKFDEMIAKLMAEHISLRQRQVLGKNIIDVVTFVENLAWIKKAGEAKPNTRFVTDKQKSLFQTLIEGAYKALLEEECDKLDCALPIEFKARGSAGKTLRGLKVQGGHKPEDIFSEGEQRGLALADFLTEVNLNPASAAIVFDDPVTSMDHLRKERIALRLAYEATNRQVAVFTHDLVFLSKILDAAENIGIEAVCHTVDWYDARPGHILNNESPANSQAYRDTKRAKEFLDSAKLTSGREKVDCVRQGAGALRRTIEEVVILHLFKGVVRRWNENVRLGRVAVINWSDEIADEVELLLDGTSRIIESHSNSDEYAGGMPDVAALEGLIINVDDFIKKVRPDRIKAT